MPTRIVYAILATIVMMFFSNTLSANNDFSNRASIGLSVGTAEVTNNAFSSSFMQQLRFDYAINSFFSISLSYRNIDEIKTNGGTSVVISYDENFSIGGVINYPVSKEVTSYLRYDYIDWDLQSTSLGTVIGKTDGNSNAFALGLRSKINKRYGLTVEIARIDSVDDTDIQFLNFGGYIVFK